MAACASPGRRSPLTSSPSTPSASARASATASSPGPSRHVTHVAYAKVAAGHRLGPWIHPTAARDIGERVLQRTASASACGAVQGTTASPSISATACRLDAAIAGASEQQSTSPRYMLPRALATGGRASTGAPPAGAPGLAPSADAEELLGSNAWAESLAAQEGELRQILPLIEKSLANWHPSMVTYADIAHLTQWSPPALHDVCTHLTLRHEPAHCVRTECR